jgi:hypothetical protein
MHFLTYTITQRYHKQRSVHEMYKAKSSLREPPVHILLQLLHSKTSCWQPRGIANSPTKASIELSRSDQSLHEIRKDCGARSRTKGFIDIGQRSSACEQPNNRDGERTARQAACALAPPLPQADSVCKDNAISPTPSRDSCWIIVEKILNVIAIVGHFFLSCTNAHALWMRNSIVLLFLLEQVKQNTTSTYYRRRQQYTKASSRVCRFR